MSDNGQEEQAQTIQINNMASLYATSLVNMFNLTGVTPSFRLLVGVHLAASSGMMIEGLDKDKFVGCASTWWDEYSKIKENLEKNVKERFADGQAN